MPNTLVTATWVTNESADRYMNSLEFVSNINREYSKQFRTHDGAKVGNTVYVRLPNLFTVRDGQAWAPQGLLDRTTPITLTYQSGVDMEWSRIQETTEIDKIKERYIGPAADALAAKVDQRAMADVYKSVYNGGGTPGTTPTANTTFMTAAAKIFQQSGPSTELCAILDVASQIALVNANFSVFNPQAQISEQYKKGRFGRDALGISEWYTSQTIPTHTTGSAGSGTPVVDTASQTGSSITVTWTNGSTSLKAGDLVEFAGVYSVDALAKQSSQTLMQFTLTADCTDSSGTITLPISPPIITSGPLQNVSGSPALNAAVYFWNTRSTTYTCTATATKQNLIFHPNAFGFATADLADPIAGAKATFARSEDLGISMRLVQQYLLQPDQNGTRLDVIYGAAPIQARLAARVAQ